MGINSAAGPEPEFFVDTEEWKRFRDVLGGESDRGCALIGMAFLDDQLAKLLGGYLTVDRRGYTELLGSESRPGSLGTLGVRIAAAHAIGLIDRDIRDEIRSLSVIRNRFAHDIYISFEDAKVSARCSKLAFGRNEVSANEEAPSSRRLFESSTRYIVGYLNACIGRIRMTSSSGHYRQAARAYVDRLFRESLSEVDGR